MSDSECAGACAACGGTLVFFGPRGRYEYHRCRACGSIQLHPLPTPEELRRAYAGYQHAGHYEADPELARRINANNYRTLLDALVAHRVRGPVLDYGSGWGGLVELLQREGLACSGLDWNAPMVDYCRGRGLPVELGDFEALGERRFGALALATVFEHLVDHDRWLERAAHALEPGGLVVTLNPTARFAGLVGTALRLGQRGRELPELIELFSPPWHTAFFSLKGMEKLFARHGFRLCEVRFTRSTRQPGATGWLQAALETVNRAGWRAWGADWPLQVCHTFVFQKAERA